MKIFISKICLENKIIQMIYKSNLIYFILFLKLNRYTSKSV